MCRGCASPRHLGIYFFFVVAAFVPPLGFFAPPLLPGPLSGIPLTPFPSSRLEAVRR